MLLLLIGAANGGIVEGADIEEDGVDCMDCRSFFTASGAAGADS